MYAQRRPQKVERRRQTYVIMFCNKTYKSEEWAAQMTETSGPGEKTNSRKFTDRTTEL